MKSSYQMNRKFNQDIFSQDILEDVIDWIGRNLMPEDIFDAQELRNWVEESDYFAHDAGLERAIEIVNDYALDPSKVFNYCELASWAETNGFVEDEKNEEKMNEYRCKTCEYFHYYEGSCWLNPQVMEKDAGAWCGQHSEKILEKEKELKDILCIIIKYLESIEIGVRQ